MKNGVVKFFNEEKGFGFIVDNETKKDIFVHKTALSGKIRENDQVQFEVEETPRGLSAINVSLV